MRGATQCTRRLKTLFSSLRSKLGKLAPPTGGDALTQCILGVLSRDVPESKAREALDRIRALVVDYNELRVMPPLEVAEAVGDYPDVRLKCEDISRALNKIFALNHAVSLDHLSGQSRKETVAFLDKLDGLEPYTRARIRLLGLQQHAVPLDEAMWAFARREAIVDPRCPLEEAQSFLERQIREGDALEFVALLHRQAWNEMASAVRKREVARIVSVPPDRTARNMLQMIGAAAVPLPEPAAEPSEPAGPAKTKAKPARGKPSAPAAPAGKSRASTRQPARPAAQVRGAPAREAAASRSRHASRSGNRRNGPVQRGARQSRVSGGAG